MPGHRSRKRIGSFRKKHRQMKEDDTNSLDESNFFFDKSTNTDIVSTTENSTMTTWSSLSTVDKETNTSIAEIETDSETVTNISPYICYANLILPSTDWYIKRLPGEVIRVFHVRHLDPTSNKPISVSRSLIVHEDYTWTCSINGLTLPKTSSVCSSTPDILSLDDFSSLLSSLLNTYVCPGNADSRFVEFCNAKKGKFLSVKKTVVGFLDQFDGTSTVRHILCDLLVRNSKRCGICCDYRKRLRSMLSSFKKSSNTLPKTNNQFLNTPLLIKQKKVLRSRVKKLTTQNKRLKSKLELATKKSGVILDSALETDMVSALRSNEKEMECLPINDFKRIFWEQQVSAMKAHGTSGIRYHPLFVRWCLSIMLSSPKTYSIIRDSGLITLPSERTLKDYTNWFKPKLGYQNEVFMQLKEDYEVDHLNPAQRNVVLCFDEMKIREGLVFDNATGNIIGFVDTGDMNKMLSRFEADVKGERESQEIATHMLAVCVRGIFLKLDYPLGQFSTTSVSGHQLYDIVWTAIRRLMNIGMEVVIVVADGASNNRKFFKLHRDQDVMKGGVVYKAKNIYDTSKWVWFMSDICHLLKTTRNCWENSSKNGTRHLEINGKHILWSHLIEIYNWSRQDTGLYIGNKLTMEHVKLTSYSRMNVRLAAQVLSKSVADLFKVKRETRTEQEPSIYSDTSETETFCRMFNYLFDCMNTRHLYEAKHKRNEALKAYSSKEDPRLKWLENEFLSYLEEWKQYADSRRDLPNEERQKLTLSCQTLEGLKITVYSFIEVVPFLLSLEGAKFVFSEKFNQDNVEILFGKQRARCGRGDNPTVHSFLYNTQAIRTTRSLSLGSCSNIKKRKLFHNVEELSEPLRKKPRRK